jgi:carbamoyl-phosphate synthase small subunit
MADTLTLTLKDKTQVAGESFGASLAKSKVGAGEVVFATGMVGYPESMTDPSYAGQILVMTYPLIGNYGVPSQGQRTKDKVEKNFESSKIHIAGLVVSEYSEKYSHHAAKESLAAWLKREGVPAITGVDTRALTQKLREHGTILGKFESRTKDTLRLRSEQAGQRTNKFYNPAEEHLVSQVSPKEAKFYKGGPKTVAILDCGMKLGILRNFLERGVSVWHLPHDADLSKYEYDGLFISNGPGDPEQARETIASIRTALKGNKPIFGICLGNQLVALAAGMKTFKLPYGHRSQNQPVKELRTGRCFITSQNHGYAVTRKLKPGWEVAMENLNDKSIEGLRHKSKPFFTVQFHPEACPGPTDTRFLFDEFIKLL